MPQQKKPEKYGFIPDPPAPAPGVEKYGFIPDPVQPQDAASGAGFGVPADLPPKRSLLEDIRASLEPSAGAGLFERSIKGPARAVAGMAALPFDIHEASTRPPETPTEDVLATVSRGSLISPLAIKRLGVDPSLEMFSKAKEHLQRADPVQSGMFGGLAELGKAGLYGLAGSIPLVGPYAASLAERAAGGDIAGAITEGATSVFLPKAPGALKRGMAWAARTEPVVRNVFRGGPARMEKTPQGGPVAQGGGTRGDVARFAQEKGIDLLPGQATESRPLQGLQAVGERAIYGGEKIQNFIEQQRGQLAKNLERVKEDYAPAEEFPDPASIGQHLQEKTHSLMDNMKADAQADFTRWAERSGRAEADMRPIQQKYQAKLEGMRRALANSPRSYSGPILAVLEKAAAFGSDAARPFLNLLDLQQLRTAFWEIANDYQGTVGTQVNRHAAEIVQDLDSVMATTAEQAGTLDLWRDANAKWKNMERLFNKPDSPLTRILKEPDPGNVPGKLLAQGNVGGSVRTLKMMKEAGLDLGSLKRQIIDEISQRGFKIERDGHRLGGYSHHFLSELFTPAELTELYAYGRIGRAVKFEVNPSGTSVVTEMGGQTRRFPWGLLGSKIPADLTMNPQFGEAMTGIRPRPRGSLAADLRAQRPRILPSTRSLFAASAGARQQPRLEDVLP